MMASQETLDQAIQLVRQGRLREAERAARELLQARETRGDAQFLLGAIAFRQENYLDAGRRWTVLSREQPGLHDVETWVEQARKNLDQAPAKPVSPARVSPNRVSPAPAASSETLAPALNTPPAIPDAAPASSLLDDMTPPPPEEHDDRPVKQVRLGVDDFEPEETQASLGSKIIAAVLVVALLGVGGYLLRGFIVGVPNEDEVAMANDPESACSHLLNLLEQYGKAYPGATFGRVLRCFTKEDQQWFEDNLERLTHAHNRAVRMVIGAPLETTTDPIVGRTLTREAGFRELYELMPGKNVHEIILESVAGDRAVFTIHATLYLDSGEAVPQEYNVEMKREGRGWKGHGLFGARKAYEEMF